jgi:hypothetical protein
MRHPQSLGETVGVVGSAPCGFFCGVFEIDLSLEGGKIKKCVKIDFL